MKQPARLVLYDHSEIYRRKINWMRSEQSVIALMTMQLSRLAIAGFGGKGGGDSSIEDYLPIKEILASDDPRALMAGYLGKKTYDIFQAVSKSKDVNPYMLKAFSKNKLLVDAMELIKNNANL